MLDAPPIVPLAREGRLRARSHQRQTLEALPDVPTVAATLPGFDVSTWVGIFAPGKTPPEIIARQHSAHARDGPAGRARSACKSRVPRRDDGVDAGIRGLRGLGVSSLGRCPCVTRRSTSPTETATDFNPGSVGPEPAIDVERFAGDKAGLG